MATPTSIVPAGTTGHTITFTYTASTGGLVNGQVVLVVPAGWSAPSVTANAPGYATASAGTRTISSRWIIVSNVTLSAGETLTITYGSKSAGGPGATAASAIGTQTWQAKERSTVSGLLTNLATSPAIHVQ